MTWATVRGVRVWNHKTFVEPPDEELVQYGWAGRVKAEKVEGDRNLDHPCVDCPKLIHRQATRCMDCYRKNRQATRAPEPPPRSHACVDCPTQIVGRSKRCKSCHLKSMVAASLSGATRREEVDEIVVQKILAGDWVKGTPTTKGEKLATTAAWIARGRAQNELHRITGWRVERYVQRDIDVEDVAA